MTDSYAIVGASADNDKGAAYIYGKGSDGSWSGTALLTLNGVVSGGQFGYGVSMADSYAMVGAPGDADNNNGAAYIYGKGSDGSWSGTALLTLNGTASGGYFGVSVSMTDSYAIVGAV